jgi:hypothetical protein
MNHLIMGYAILRQTHISNDIKGGNIYIIYIYNPFLMPKKAGLVLDLFISGPVFECI